MGLREIEDLLREYGENPGRSKKKPVHVVPTYYSLGETRTPDLVVNSHPLYQLSYKGSNVGKDIGILFSCQQDS